MKRATLILLGLLLLVPAQASARTLQYRGGEAGTSLRLSFKVEVTKGRAQYVYDVTARTTDGSCLNGATGQLLGYTSPSNRAFDVERYYNRRIFAVGYTSPLSKTYIGGSFPLRITTEDNRARGRLEMHQGFPGTSYGSYNCSAEHDWKAKPTS